MDTTIQLIHENLDRVNQKIQNACSRSGRNMDSVRVVVVTKGQPLSMVQYAIEAGARILGENYPEEAVDKIASCQKYSDIEWHMIGHLQSRKAKLVMGNFNILHSLDSLSLAEKLERLLVESGQVLGVLIEFNLSGEVSKFGLGADDPNQWDSLLPDIEKICNLRHVKIAGLMTMPPLSAFADEVRPYFKKLRDLQSFLNKNIPAANWNELSMGTSTDYEVAVEEGATYVRIGQAILGLRPQRG